MQLPCLADKPSSLLMSKSVETNCQVRAPACRSPFAGQVNLLEDDHPLLRQLVAVLARACGRAMVAMGGLCPAGSAKGRCDVHELLGLLNIPHGIHDKPTGDLQPNSIPARLSLRGVCPRSLSYVRL